MKKMCKKANKRLGRNREVNPGSRLKVLNIPRSSYTVCTPAGRAEKGGKVERIRSKAEKGQRIRSKAKKGGKDKKQGRNKEVSPCPGLKRAHYPIQLLGKAYLLNIILTKMQSGKRGEYTTFAKNRRSWNAA